MQSLPRLQMFREAVGWSARRLAERANVSRHTVRNIEQGNPALDSTAEALAAALGVLVEDLAGRPELPEEQADAYLEGLLSEKKTHGPGDWVYDSDPLSSMSNDELAQFVRQNPGLRRAAEQLRVRELLRRGIEAEARERDRLQEERSKDAG